MTVIFICEEEEEEVEKEEIIKRFKRAISIIPPVGVRWYCSYLGKLTGALEDFALKVNSE